MKKKNKISWMIVQSYMTTHCKNKAIYLFGDLEWVCQKIADYLNYDLELPFVYIIDVESDMIIDIEVKQKLTSLPLKNEKN